MRQDRPILIPRSTNRAARLVACEGPTNEVVGRFSTDSTGHRPLNGQFRSAE